VEDFFHSIVGRRGKRQYLFFGKAHGSSIGLRWICPGVFFYVLLDQILRSLYKESRRISSAEVVVQSRSLTVE